MGLVSKTKVLGIFLNCLVSSSTLFLHWQNLGCGDVGTEQLEMGSVLVYSHNGCVTLGESLALSELSSSPGFAFCL